jgi:hypothetical protein
LRIRLFSFALAALVAGAPPALASPEEGEDEPPIEVRAAVGVLGTTGLSFRPTAGFSAQLGASYGSFMLALEARGDLLTTLDVSGGSGQVSSTAIVGSLLPCIRSDDLDLCPQLTIGSLHSSSVGTVAIDEASASLTLLLGGARAAYRWKLQPGLELRVHAELLGAFKRVAVTIGNGGDVLWRSPPATASLGVELVLPL